MAFDWISLSFFKINAIKKRVKNVLQFVININNNYKHFLTLIALAFSFLISNYKIEQLNSVFQLEKKEYQKEIQVLTDKVNACEAQKVNYLELKRKYELILLEVDSWKIAAFMYSGKHQDDSLFSKALKELIEPFDNDSIFLSPKEFKNGY